MNDSIWLITISVLQFTSVALFIWTVFRIRLQSEPPVNRQIAMALGLHSRNTAFETPVVRQFMLACVMVAQRFPLFRERIRQDLDASGNPNGYTVEEYVAVCVACGIMVGVVGVFAATLFGPIAVFVIVGGPIVGFWAPMWALHEAARKRTVGISKKVPYTLDLIALLMEAGASFTEAIETCVRDEPDDHFHQELKLVQAEIEFGTPRSGALMNMARRIPLDSLRGVVGAINQSEALGTPLSTILKNQSSMLRHLRSVRAEELAAKASLRILIPSMFILLAVVLVVFAPFILSLWKGDGSFTLGM